MTHICVGKLTIIVSDNGLWPGRRQANIWTNAGILLIGPLGTNFSEILIGIKTFSFKKMHLKMSSVKWLAFCLGLNVLISYQQNQWELYNAYHESDLEIYDLYCHCDIMPVHYKPFRIPHNITRPFTIPHNNFEWKVTTVCPIFRSLPGYGRQVWSSACPLGCHAQSQ